MKRLIAGILLSVAALSVCCSNGLRTNDTEILSKDETGMAMAPGAVIVKYKDEAPDLSGFSHIVKMGEWNFSSINDTYSIGYFVSDEMTTASMIAMFEQFPQVSYAEPDYEYQNLELTNDTFANKQWYFSKDAENFGGVDTPDIAADYAWEKLEEIASEKIETVVAIIDTGVDYTHPDLIDHMWVNTTTLPGVHGYDFINDDDDPMDDYGHGTHCAGIIAAQINNQMGIAGVSPNTKIMALKYMDEQGQGVTSQAVAAYEYIIEAKRQGVNVVAISNSWGTTENPKALEDIIRTAGEMGIVTVCAAGNFGTDQEINKIFPAGYDSPYIVVVAASTQEDKIASFSSYGKSVVDVAAPGTSILSCYHKEAYMPGLTENDRLFYPFEDGRQPFYGNNISVTDIKAFQGSNSLLWRTTLAQDLESYEPQSTKNYLNTLTFTTDASVKGEYFGFNFLVDGSTEGGQYLYVDAYSNYQWTNLTEISISDINYWNSKYYLLPENTTRIRLIALNMSQGTQIYLDNIGIGTSTGKYAYLQGTSMAAPIVAGEISILARMFPEESVAKIRARVVGGVDHVIASGLVVSDGRINLERAIMNPYPVIDTLSCDTKGELTLNGYFFGTSNGTVTINGVVAPLISWSDQKVIVGYNNEYDGYTNIGLTRGDDNESSEQKLLLSNIGDHWKRETDMPVGISSAAVTGLGDYIYVIGGSTSENVNSNDVYRYDTVNDRWDQMSSLPKSSHIELYQESMSCAGIQDKIILLTTDVLHHKNIFFLYSVKEDSWSEMTFIQAPEYRTDACLSVMNGFVYLIGGIADKDAAGQEERLKKIWILNEDMTSWDIAGSLNNVRYNAICGVADGKLVITGGYSYDAQSMTSTEVFDGSAVSAAADILLDGADKDNTIYGGEDQFMVMTDGVSFETSGVVYNVISNTWTYSNYRIGFDKYIRMGSAVANGRLYCVGGKLNGRITEQVFSISLIAEPKAEAVPDPVQIPEPQRAKVTQTDTQSKEWAIRFLWAAIIVVAGCITAIFIFTRKTK